MARIAKDWIGTYFEKGVDYTNRRLFLLDEIYEDSIRAIVQGLKLLESAGNDTIEIYIGTYGGDIYDMFCLYDVIRDSKCHIKTVGVGKVMSAGPLLVTAGDERLCYPHTTFMVHEIAWSSWQEKLGDQKVNLKHSEELQDVWSKCLEERTGTPSKKWLKLMKGSDTYIDAVAAQELGIVEKIIQTK